MEGLKWLENFRQDLRHGVRLLIRNPGVSVVAILTLALGIGANTAIFSVVEGLLLKPLPYPDPERLVVPATIFQRYKTDQGSVAYADALDWKAQADLFEAVSVFSGTTVDVTGGEEPERIQGLDVDEDYFRVMGRPLLFGRSITAAEARPGSDQVAVLGYGFWMRRFGGDPKVVGRRIETSVNPCTVVGIAQKDSTWPSEAEIFLPLAVARDADLMRRDNHVFGALARLRKGVSLEQAQARLTVMGELIAQNSVNRAGTNWKLHPLNAYTIGPTIRQTLWVLLAASLFVLLIACVNVANLLLVRGAVREREVAIRSALGGSWKRLSAQFLAESALLSGAGGLVGVFAGYWGLHGLIHLAPAEIPRLELVAIDLKVLGFAAALSVGSSILSGLLPAVHAVRSVPLQSLHEASRGTSGGRRGRRLRGSLVVTELALAIVLLTGAGLLIRSFSRMLQINPGFPTRNLLTMQITLPHARYQKPPQIASGLEQFPRAIRRIRGVLSASATSSLPLGGGGFYLGRVFLKEGQPEPPASTDTSAAWSVVHPDYFQSMQLQIIKGRGFTERDTSESAPVIIISQSMASQMFPGEEPLGRRIRSWRDENKYREIVGVVGDLRYYGLAQDIRNMVYVPHEQDAWRAMVLVVRTAGDPSVLMKTICSEIWSVDKKLAIAEAKTMAQIMDTEFARPRFSMFLLGIFGATALVLAAIGIYGVMAYSVTQRTREIGIRMALGAARSDVLRIVTGSASWLAVAGALCGIVGALGLTHLMKSLLFDVPPTDTLTFALVAGLLIAVALTAAYIPARRAAKVDPVVALRYE